MNTIAAWFRLAFKRIQVLWIRHPFVGSIVLSFFFVPLFAMARDKLYKTIIEPPEYFLSVYVCAPVNVLRHWIVDAEGQNHPLPPAFLPTTFHILLKNDGARHLEDNEFLIVLKKDISISEVKDSSDLSVSKLFAASRSPLDQPAYTAEFSANMLKLSAKRMNPGDFILVEGDTNRPVMATVFSRSVGLTQNESRGAASCSLFSVHLGNAYVFFRQQ
jgi:hypothetical protein